MKRQLLLVSLAVFSVGCISGAASSIEQVRRFAKYSMLDVVQGFEKAVQEKNVEMKKCFWQVIARTDMRDVALKFAVLNKRELTMNALLTSISDINVNFEDPISKDGFLHFSPIFRIGRLRT